MFKGHPTDSKAFIVANVFPGTLRYQWHLPAHARQVSAVKCHQKNTY